ncbi:MAG: tRNA preQ1(34) S-adenosylmethionine ribosyltransferase-isomerase QueA [Planctomycetaceae bacterium]|nr:tRNA preQ1(34) S-adenosylmethionine ribosyltransferase-isomerase QueA [Planctomycetaceae bacterium]
MEALCTNDFDYALPPDLIAQFPPPQRGQSRMMVLDRPRGGLSGCSFADLPRFLRRGDVLVVNDTRVLAARFFCRRASRGRIEGLFLHQSQPRQWQVLLKGAGRCRIGEVLVLENAEDISLTLQRNLGQGHWQVATSTSEAAGGILARAGTVPLPPYIRRDGRCDDQQDRLRYQTVYARRDGAVAAPTAGLHFTQELLAELAGMGVDVVRVTLHVGVGTFAPVKADRLADHQMHSEWYELSAPAAERLNAARAAGGRIVAVGTTSVRVLETIASANAAGGAGESSARQAAPCPLFVSGSGWTDIFIYPPAVFRAVDALITNFHLPRSTLLMLVAAFCSPGSTDGVGMIRQAYQQAVREKYRFFSYGDAMLIL